MLRRRLLLLVVLLALVAVPPAVAGSFTKRGTVERVIDGDTLVLRTRGGDEERVRLIGIDTPEVGSCYAARATQRARSLAGGARVVVTGDPTQATRDRYGRLLGYVGLPGGIDLGRRLVLGGFGKVYVYDRPFRRLTRYRQAEGTARRLGRGLWSACGSPGRGGDGGAGCHPSYSPCLPIVGDLDCGEIADSKKPVSVRGSDPYRLDGDGDGVGCE